MIQQLPREKDQEEGDPLRFSGPLKPCGGLAQLRGILLGNLSLEQELSGSYSRLAFIPVTGLCEHFY